MMRAVIFDMDGVIADTETIDYIADYNVLKSIGAVESKADHVRSAGVPARHTYNRILSQKNIDADVNELLRKREVEFEKALASKKLKLSDGFNSLVKNLKEKGYKVALASSSSARKIGQVLSALRLKNVFSATVSSNDVKINKPSPDIYIETARRLNLSPDECVAVEDSETGVASAKSAGLKCIAVRTKQTEEHDLSAADVVVSRLKDIKIDAIDKL